MSHARAQAALPAVAMVSASGAWLVIFFDTFVRIPVEIGFDARHHALYVDMLRTQGAVPVATDGWSGLARRYRRSIRTPPTAPASSARPS